MSSSASYSRYAVNALMLLAALLLIGSWPTWKLGGQQALVAMGAGAAASLVGSLGAALLVRTTVGKPLVNPVPLVMGTMGLRIALVLSLGVVLALVGGFQRVPLLLWLAIAHLVLLIVDTRYTLSVVGRGIEQQGLEQKQPLQREQSGNLGAEKPGP